MTATAGSFIQLRIPHSPPLRLCEIHFVPGANAKLRQNIRTSEHSTFKMSFWSTARYHSVNSHSLKVSEWVSVIPILLGSVPTRYRSLFGSQYWYHPAPCGNREVHSIPTLCGTGTPVQYRHFGDISTRHSHQYYIVHLAPFGHCAGGLYFRWNGTRYRTTAVPVPQIPQDRPLLFYYE
jgi:hypothetical protein